MQVHHYHLGARPWVGVHFLTYGGNNTLQIHVTVIGDGIKVPPSSVQFISVAQSGPILCDPVDCSTPGFPVHHQLLEPTQTPVHHASDAIQPSHPLSSPSPAFNLSQHQGLSNESVLQIGWPKYWSFSFSISPSNEYSALISFSIDWLDLLAVQGTLKSLFQHHSSEASILQCSAFFIAPNQRLS